MRFWWLYLIVLTSGGCEQARPPVAKAASPAAERGGAIRLIEPPPGPRWTLPAGDNANTRYSSLSQINTENVRNLRVHRMFSTGVARGHEGQPLVVDDTLYVVTPFPNDLMAIDLRDLHGAIKWRYHPHPDQTAIGKACCDVVNRGASYAAGKIIYNLLDAHTVAVDAASGKEVWRTKVGDVNLGETTTMAPLVVKDRVIVGNSGGEMGVRGKLVALDLESGKEIWRGYSTGPDRDVLIGPDFAPFYPDDRGQNLGVRSWPPEQWKLGGSTVWGWISYDPQLNLIYYGTANPGTWNAEARPGDNKWSCSIIARDADTGRVRWADQLVPHDAWDYDEIMENVLVDMDWHGKPRKLLLHPGRVGFMFVIDRETGEMLSAEPFMPINWAKRYDLKSGRPEIDPDKVPRQGKVVRDICPSSTGAKDFSPSALSPRTGLLYIPAHNTCMEFEPVQANYIAGTPYVGADVKMYPGAEQQGELVAWDVARAKKVWSVKHRFPLYSGVLATAGDVVFWGALDGYFYATDARSGKELWKLKLPSGIVGNPMTYLGPDGKQYVAIYSGVGGWMGTPAFQDVSADDPYAALGVVGAMKDLKRYTEAGDVVFILGL
ncbi:MAG TPA: PQQ-dependent dehydrogenase, methanol/ethanol family [Polyangiales bacterium]|nr:PQQ-dependent dehydrogenase, methanol/ethanol family [Polyangiales bacterium]